MNLFSALRHNWPPQPAPGLRAAAVWRDRLRALAGWIGVSGFVAGFAWAFVGSLLLGLGSSPAGRATAYGWLAVELIIGAAVFIALLLGAPPGQSDS